MTEAQWRWRFRAWLVKKLMGRSTVIMNTELSISEPVEARGHAVFINVGFTAAPDPLPYAIEPEGIIWTTGGDWDGDAPVSG